MKYYLIAGEASGDLHASNLMKEILAFDKEADFRFYGGDKMKAVGGSLVKHYRELALMGIIEVFKNLRKFAGFLNDCKNDVLEFHPDVLILIDYSGFNLRMAKAVRKYRIPVYYYITPKLWAWGKSRAKKIRRYVDKVFVILPFEVEFFKKLNIKAQFFGNPVADEISNFSKAYKETGEEFRSKNKLDDKQIIALLAGSRIQEINLCLPEMIEAAKKISGYQFVIAGASSIPRDYYDSFIEKTGIRLVYDQTYALLKHSYAAVVTSGTATLETALLNIPQVVIYKTSSGTYSLGQFFIKLGVIHVKFFSLVNIILDRELVKELLQYNLVDSIIPELSQLLNSDERRKEILDGYDEMKGLLGGQGASKRVAEEIVGLLSGKK